MSCERFSHQLATGEISSRQEIVRHVENCNTCRDLWISAGLLQQSMPRHEGVRQACPETRHLLPWWDGSLAEAEVVGLARHVAACGPCLNELGALFRDLERLEDAELAIVPSRLEQAVIEKFGAATPVARPARHRSWALLPAAAGFLLVALGVGMLLVDPNRSLFGRPSSTVLRGTEPQSLQVIAPVGAVDYSDPLRFEWSDANGGIAAGQPARRYRIIILDLETGETVIEAVAETTLFVPRPDEARRFAAGRRYHWVVEPLGGGGGTPSEAAVFWRAP